jgi:hypothetical protein
LILNLSPDLTPELNPYLIEDVFSRLIIHLHAVNS